MTSTIRDFENKLYGGTKLETGAKKALVKIAESVELRDVSYRMLMAGLHENNEKNVLKALKDCPEIVVAKDDFGRTPLMIAAQKGSEVCFKYILLKCDTEKLQKSNLQDNKKTALHYMAQGGQHKLLELAQKKLKDVNPVDDLGKTPLDIANECRNLTENPTEKAKYQSFITTLQKLGGQTGEAVLGANPALKREIDQNKASIAGKIKEKLDQKSEQRNLDDCGYEVHGMTPKYWLQELAASIKAGDIASFQKNYAIYSKENQPKAVVRMKKGHTFLTYAAMTGKKEMLKFLVQQFPQDINEHNRKEEGKTPLHYAAQQGDVASTSILLNCKNIDINSLDNYRRTPLDVAILNKQKGVEAVLRSRGAKTYEELNLAQTSARYKKQLEQLFIERGPLTADEAFEALNEELGLRFSKSSIEAFLRKKGWLREEKEDSSATAGSTCEEVD